MTALTLDARMGASVQIDLCLACQVIWFDHLESVRLSPAATLEVFRVIGERSGMSPAPMRSPMACPRCELRLLLTHDRQRNTPFRYWRCARNHGRLTTFFDFLREKDFIRPLSAQQIAELRDNVQHLNCSNCGAPIDLAHESACAHCGSAISMLDVKQVEAMADHLRRAGEPKPVDPTLPLRLERERRDVEAVFARLQADGDWNPSMRIGLVEAGLKFLSRRLR
jgi:hypothetical protein